LHCHESSLRATEAALASPLNTDDQEPNIDNSEQIESLPSWKTVLASWLADVFLFCATAAVVLWQNSRITVLYDLSGVIEPAYRMSLGDRPYADFPFPYAPLTFWIQSEIIRLWGTVYWHHIAYAAMAAGLATVLTWRLLVNILRDSLRWPRLTAFLLTLPVVVLGIYCIFPHPFYDPDAMLFILLSLSAILWLERREFPIIPTFLAGMLLVIPLFVKQNIGGAYLASWLLALVALAVLALWKKQVVRGYLALIVGAAVGLGVAALIIQNWVGLETYKYWTWTFATSRRTPSPEDMLSVYQDPLLIVWVMSLGAGVLLLWLNKNGKAAMSILGTFLIAFPFAWPVVYLFIDSDASERGERLANVWPVVLIASFVLCVVAIRRVSGVRKILPFVLIATAHGVFLSQQLWGSTYGIWPMFVLIVGLIILGINELTDRRFSGYLTAFAAVASICLITSGAFYVYSNDRLDYVDFEDGDMQHSTLPQLQGLSIRGDFLPDFEELVRYSNENIPAGEGILEVPGEDLFYYTTGRRPMFPTLLFDITNNPYSAEQIADLARERGIKWLIVKNDLQINVESVDESGKPVQTDKTIDDKDHILEVLKPEFKHIESLNNYEIYRRKLPGETDDEDEDDNDNDSGDDDSDPAQN
jgi:hypothetical protein